MWKDLSFKERVELINQWSKEHVLDYAKKKREYDEAHRFDDGGDASTYYAGELPEITVVPTKESIALRREVQSIIKDPVLRKQFFKYIYNSDKGMDNPAISDNDKVDRFLRLYKDSGFPNIHLLDSNKRPLSINRPFSTSIFPGLNSLHIPVSYYGNEEEDGKIIVAELSHAWQFKNDRAKEMNLRPNPYKLAMQTINRIYDDEGNYQRIGNYEFNAHGLIEPVMHDYISGKTNDFEGDLKAITEDAWEHPDAYSGGIDRYAKTPNKTKGLTHNSFKGSK